MAIENAFAWAFAKPWVDPLCLWGLGRLLPAASAWAAAGLAGGDPDSFAAILGLDRAPRELTPRLMRTRDLRQQHEAAMVRWQDALFGGKTMAAEIARRESERRRAAQDYLGQRFAYLGFARRQRLPMARFTIETPDRVLADLAPALRDPESWLRGSDLPSGLAASDFTGDGTVREYWLKFSSPIPAKDDADIGWVRVLESAEACNPPALIFGHGLAMETEMTKLADPRGLRDLAASGWRILLPDAPGHNRRCPLGRYGGESFLAEAPRSGLDHFWQAAREFAALAKWCRDRGSLSVAWGGISLGALTAQAAATRSAAFPPEARPDALLLLTTTADIAALAFDSAIAGLGLRQALIAAGWQASHFAALAGLFDAPPAPPIDPGKIVILLGERDTVTPYDGGARLARDWRLPPENVFRRDLGHFSAAIGLGLDPSPFLRLRALLSSGPGAL